MRDDYRLLDLAQGDLEKIQLLEQELAEKYGRPVVLMAYDAPDDAADDRQGAEAEAKNGGTPDGRRARDLRLHRTAGQSLPHLGQRQRPGPGGRRGAAPGRRPGPAADPTSMRDRDRQPPATGGLHVRYPVALTRWPPGPAPR